MFVWIFIAIAYSSCPKNCYRYPYYQNICIPNLEWEPDSYCECMPGSFGVPLWETTKSCRVFVPEAVLYPADPWHPYGSLTIQWQFLPHSTDPIYGSEYTNAWWWDQLLVPTTGVGVVNSTFYPWSMFGGSHVAYLGPNWATTQANFDVPGFYLFPNRTAIGLDIQLSSFTITLKASHPIVEGMEMSIPTAEALWSDVPYLNGIGNAGVRVIVTSPLRTCDGINATDPNVCGGIRNCDAQDHCLSCRDPALLEVDECILACWGTRNDTGTACSSHGSCVAPNNCSCTNGYVGDDCSIMGCTNDTVTTECNRHGVCTEAIPNYFCNCTGNFVGRLCDECAPFYSGSNCTLLNCSGLCGVGECIYPGVCVCPERFAGAFCENCAEFYNGTNCLLNCTVANVTCSGRGNCTFPGICHCSSEYSGVLCTERVLPPLAWYYIFLLSFGGVSVFVMLAAVSVSNLFGVVKQ